MSSSKAASKEVLKEKKAGVVRTLIAGALMGIANIIPGVSGGTMILALGLYEQFVGSIAELSRLRFAMKPVLFLALLGGAAILSIALMTVPIVWSLENHHHIMFGLFIGLTLGGVPLVWREMRPVKPTGIAGLLVGLIIMIGVFLLKNENLGLPLNWFVLLFAGMIASAAMVLPGISGSYLLLVAGLYLPVTRAIKAFASALKDMQFGEIWSIGLGIGLPIALGILIGIVGLTNALKKLLERYHGSTIGTLLGLLVGSVLGLYPFSPLVEKGEVFAEPHPVTPMNIVLVAVAIAIGFAVTWGVSKLGGEDAEAGKAF